MQCPQAIAKNPISTVEIAFKKNSLYEPCLINSNNWKVHPLNVVNDPQNPNPKINLEFIEIGKEFIKPNKKQPIIFTIKISSICQRNILAGTAPSDIKKKLFFFKELYIY